MIQMGKQPTMKAHLYLLREIVVNPPKPPFSIVLTDSGQKHLVFFVPKYQCLILIIRSC